MLESLISHKLLVLKNYSLCSFIGAVRLACGGKFYVT